MFNGIYKFEKIKNTGEREFVQSKNKITNWGLFNILKNNFVVTNPYGGFSPTVVTVVEKIYLITDDRDLNPSDESINVDGLISLEVKSESVRTNINKDDLTQVAVFAKDYSFLMFSGETTIKAVAGFVGDKCTTFTKLESPVTKSSDEILKITYSIEYEHSWPESLSQTNTIAINEKEYNPTVKTNVDLIDNLTFDTIFTAFDGMNPFNFDYNVNHSDKIIGNTSVEFVKKIIGEITNENFDNYKMNFTQLEFITSAFIKIVFDKEIELPETFSENIPYQFPGIKYVFGVPGFNKTLFEQYKEEANTPGGGNNGGGGGNNGGGGDIFEPIISLG